jgi:antibiotic biosynthesis monooxygenase (ABM) superfamily enzyme
MASESTNHTKPDLLTVVVHRRVKVGKQIEFERSMRGFVEFALSFAGHLAIHVLLPPCGSRDYTVVDQFATEHARRQFCATPAYQDWMRVLGELTEGDPQIQELVGLEGWIASSSESRIERPPSWKTALATLAGVFPVAMVLNLTIGPVLRTWPFALANLVFDACMVASLTWGAMPVVTRILRRWLFPKRA